jgi:DNA repair protein RadA/Sms
MAGGNNPAVNRPGWQNSRPNNGKGQRNPQPRISVRFSEITQYEQERFPSGYGEFDRVLGGGIVPGSLVLIGGDPGIGKSTLLLQVTNQLAQRLPRILYVSAEESGQQIKLRAARLGWEWFPWSRKITAMARRTKPLNQPQNSIIISTSCQKPI